MQETKRENKQDMHRLEISRTLHAPVSLVWTVFTDPVHIAKWWGPNGFTNTIQKMDVRPGGEWELVMHGPDGTDYRNKSIFTDVIEHQLLAYDHVSGPKFFANISFRAEGDLTHITWRMEFETAELLEKVKEQFKADEGLVQNVDKLEVYLAERK